MKMIITKHGPVLLAGLLAGAIGMVQAAQVRSQDNTPPQQADSQQPMSDTWITTKVKAELLATKDVSGLDLNVETVNGVVSLSGDADTQAEADRAVAVAKAVEGVSRVDASAINVGNRADGTP